VRKLEAISKIITFLLDNLIGVAILAAVLITLWLAVGVDVRQPNQPIGGLGQTVKAEMQSLVPPKN
jgi:hypothetical protein